METTELTRREFLKRSGGGVRGVGGGLTATRSAAAGTEGMSAPGIINGLQRQKVMVGPEGVESA